MPSFPSSFCPAVTDKVWEDVKVIHALVAPLQVRVARAPPAPLVLLTSLCLAQEWETAICWCARARWRDFKESFAGVMLASYWLSELSIKQRKKGLAGRPAADCGALTSGVISKYDRFKHIMSAKSPRVCPHGFI